jgi:hypothetical protein
MAIEVALYNNDGEYEEITVSELENRIDYDKVKRNLLCAYEGCTARIEYVPKGRRVAHFKTWPMNDHSSDCIDFFEREKKRLGKRGLANSSIGLTDKHINNVLRSLINSVEETEEEKELRLQKQRSRKNRKNKTTDSSRNPLESENVRPTTDRNAEIIEEGKRAPSVKRRHSVSFLNDDDLGTATALHEKIDSITIDENRVIFLLKKNEKEAKVYFEESFFINSSRNIDNMFKVVKRIFDEGKSLTLYCVGNVEKRDGQICLVINAQSHIRINKVPIAKFVFDNSNPGLL